MYRSIVPPFDPKPARPMRPPMVYINEPLKWDYKLIVRNLETEKPLEEAELKELGKEGWEMSGVAQHASSLHYYFKRLIDR